MSGAAPAPVMKLATEFLATMTIDIGDSFLLGPTPAGARRIDVFSGGRFVGPRISGVILGGGSDLLLERGDHAMQPDVRLTVRTDDDALILVTYRGVRHGLPEAMARIARGEQVAPHEYYLRCAPFFETGAQRYAWLNGILAIGVGRRAPGQAIYDVYQVL